MFSRRGTHSVVLIEIVVGLPIFSFEVLVKLNLIQVNIKGLGPSLLQSRRRDESRAKKKIEERNKKIQLVFDSSLFIISFYSFFNSYCDQLSH